MRLPLKKQMEKGIYEPEAQVGRIGRHEKTNKALQTVTFTSERERE